CAGSGLAIRVLPDLNDATRSRVAEHTRDIVIEDLLRREPVQLSRAAIADLIRGSRVLVTGAGGSIGSELCREIGRFEPAMLVLVERAENNLFCIERELRESSPTMKLSPYLADICDAAHMREILHRHRPSIVFHAAAHKHVTM